MLLALAAISPADESIRVGGLIERFRNGAPLERRNAGQELLRCGRTIWPHFRALLNEPDPDIRRRARIIWIRIVTLSGRGWAIPKPDAPYDLNTGLPTSVFCRKTGVEFVLLLPGRAVVGNKVLQLKAPLYVGKYEVTVAEYSRGHRDLYYFYRSDRARLPATSVMREDIQAFLRDTGHRLPTAAEWEYACFAGGAQATPKAQKWSLHVAAKRKNGFALCDMIGNVAELCADGRLRGGSYLDAAMSEPIGPKVSGEHIGFRVVRSPEKVP